MKILAFCWNCEKPTDVSNEPAGDKSNGLKCKCGGFLISPSGKMQVRVIEGNEIK